MGCYGMFVMPASAATTRIELTQVPCQFLEPETKNQYFHTTHAEDCRRINQQTAAERLKHAKVLHIHAGDVVFRVRNQDVPYALGFWLRGVGLSRWRLPSVSGGGIQTGMSKDYKVHLKAGHYRYSCPLNPTPDYLLEVTP